MIMAKSAQLTPHCAQAHSIGMIRSIGSMQYCMFQVSAQRLLDLESKSHLCLLYDAGLVVYHKGVVTGAAPLQAFGDASEVDEHQAS